MAMGRAATLMGALVLGGSFLAGTAAAIPTGNAAVAGSDLHAALRAATHDVQVMVLKDTCGGECQAETVARVAAAGCDQVRLFPTLRMASARCAAPSGGGASDAADGGGGADLSHLPGVQSTTPDAVVTTSPPTRGLAGAASATDDGPAARRRSRQNGRSGARQSDVPWGVDRVNQAALPLDGNTKTTCYPRRGAGVTVYVVDSGIAVGHAQFGGRASSVVAPGADFATADDEDGHGSHVAGTVAGATTGVAPAATVIGVRCLDANGSGRLVDLLSAIEYVAAAKAAKAGAKVVLNASLGASGREASLNKAANRAAEAGVIVVVAAGNEPVSACWSDPARAAGAITVAALTAGDRLAGFSARGTKCVAVSAPGVNILSVNAFTKDGLVEFTGTSMAAPHVAGLAALVMAEDPAGGDLGRDEVLARMTRDTPIVGRHPMAWANPSCA